MNLLFANDITGEYPESYYRASAPLLPPFAPLQDDIRCDVCIVGAGYTGLSTALHLAQQGVDVVLLDAHRVGWGASGRNGGQVGPGFNMDQTSLEKKMGRESAHKLWAASVEAVDLVRRLIDTYDLDCEWVDGVVFAEWRQRNLKAGSDYVKKLRTDYGYSKLQTLSASEISAMLGTHVYAGGILDQSAGHLHPLKYAIGLARVATEAGIRLFEGTQVLDVKENSSVVVTTEQGRVSADNIVLACNGYIGQLHSDIASRVMPINNFIVATEPLDAIAPEVVAADVAVADSKFVVNYFRLTRDKRLLFGGGETYGLRFPKDIRALVAKPLRKIYPQLASVSLDYAWGGTLAITTTRMPYIAQLGNNALSASGYSGHGIALATLTGKVIADSLCGKSEQMRYFQAAPVGRFPGNHQLRSKLLPIAMTWYSMLDKLP